MATNNTNHHSIRTRLKRRMTPVRSVGLVIGLLGICVAIFGILYREETAARLVNDFYANVATELVSIAITVIIIDRMYERRSDEQRKVRLIREMGTSDNGL